MLPSVLRLAAILLAFVLTVESADAAHRYGWTISKSRTDPHVTTSTPAIGVDSVFIWLDWATLDGMTAAEFRVIVTEGSLTPLGYQVLQPFIDGGGMNDILLAVGECPRGPIPAVELTTYDATGLGGKICLAPSGAGINATVDCTPQPDLHANDYIGFANDGGEPCRSIPTGFDWIDATVLPIDDFGGYAQSTAWVDYDRDSDLDIFLTNGGPGGHNRLYRNDQNGYFTDVTTGPLAAQGHHAHSAWGDYDNDDDLDVYIVRFGEPNRLLRNDGTAFANVTQGPLEYVGYGSHASWVDYDNDDDLDCYLANQVTPNKMFRNDGSDLFVEDTPVLLEANNIDRASWADFDNDGDMDVYLWSWGGESSNLLRNDGETAFADVTTGPLAVSSANAAAWGDYDNDQDLDLYVARAYLYTNRLLRNDGGASFVNVAAPGSPLSGVGVSQDVTWLDFDQDSDLDIYVPTSGAYGNKLLRNDGGDSFVDASGGLADSQGARAAACGDYDGDGDQDVYVANVLDENNGNESRNKLFMNNAAFGQHWIQVSLVGQISNRLGVGARIRVQAAGTTQMRQVGVGSGLGHNALAASFGLGAATNVDIVEVLWPSGTTSILLDQGADRTIEIEENRWSDVTPAIFEHPVDASCVAWADYDGDGDSDLYLTNDDTSAPSTSRLFRNDDASFVDVTTEAMALAGHRAWSASWGDYDNDGDADLYVGLSHDDTGNRLFRNDGPGGFADVSAQPLSATGHTSATAWGDYDNDGDLDLYIGNGIDLANKLFRNDGSGFVDATVSPLDGSGANAVSWVDYDNDDDLDLYVVGSPQGNRMFRNDGISGFTDRTLGPLEGSGGGLGCTWGDYDNDGDLDLYLANAPYPAGETNRLLRNEGAGAFLDVTTPTVGISQASFGSVWGDLDNDGDLDLYVSNGGPNAPNQLLRNDGDGNFVPRTGAPLDNSGSGRGVALADYDLDGDLDICLANAQGMNRMFQNSEGASNHWLQVKLRGVVSNASAIGVRVIVKTPGVTQIREVSGGGSARAQDSFTAEFGLGGATVADEVRVSWPASGFVQIFAGVAADQVLEVTETNQIDAPVVSVAPATYRLHAGSPNPFRESTALRFEVPRTDQVLLKVFDVRGRHVRTLVDASLPPGRHSVIWDGSDTEGHRVGSGVYFLRMDTGGFRASQRLTHLR